MARREYRPVTLAEALISLYPNADPTRDFIVQDDGDGAYIAFWDTASLGAQPSQAQIDAAASKEPVPASVYAWQGRVVLAQVGKLDAANATVAAMGNPALNIAWGYATEWSRTSQAVIAIGTAIKLDAEAMDALFISAGKVKL